MCVCSIRLKRVYLWSSVGLYRIQYNPSFNTCVPTITWLYSRLLVVKSCENVSVLCMGVFEGHKFWSFDSIYDGNAFIILLETDDPVINNRNNLHKKSTKQDFFCKF